MLHIKQSSHFYTVTLAYETSLILQAQGVRKAWVRDYDTLPQFISITKYEQTSCAYEYNYVVNHLQAKWENDHIVIFISHFLGVYFARSMQTAVNNDIYIIYKFSPSTLFTAPEDSGHIVHR